MAFQQNLDPTQPATAVEQPIVDKTDAAAIDFFGGLGMQAWQGAVEAGLEKDIQEALP